MDFELALLIYDGHPECTSLKIILSRDLLHVDTSSPTPDNVSKTLNYIYFQHF